MMNRSKLLSAAAIMTMIVTHVSCGARDENSAKLHTTNSLNRIPGRYIVVMSPKTESATLSFARTYQAKHVYKSIFRGFSAQLDTKSLQNLLASPDVAAVYETSKVRISEVQSSPTWGIDRLDQQAPSLDAKYAYRSTGAGVTAYVIDTGITVGHKEFEDRATIGIDVTVDKGTTFENVDGHGHGTHVSGTIGSKTYGVAKKVSLVAVKVFDHTGGEASDETVLAGIDWTIEHQKANPGPAVINMSLGGEASEPMDLGVKKATEAGIAVVVAAGNDNGDACLSSPSREPTVITVASMGKNDKKSYFSNWGKCVDVIAPGSSITSTWNNGKTSVLDGTSMASPHVAGIAALYLSENPQKTPAEVQDFLISSALKDVAKGFNADTPNRIASTLWNLP